MGITYNKKLIKKDRAVATRGPRDLQNKRNVPIPVNGNNTELINNLNKQIAALTEQLNKAPASQAGLYTPEQMNEEIEKAIISETAQLNLKHEQIVKKLEVDIIELGNRANANADRCDRLVAKLASAEADVESRVESLANEVKAEYDRLLDQRDAKIASMEEAHKVAIASYKDKLASQAEMLETLKQSQGGSTENVEKMLLEATEKMERMAASMGQSESMVDPDRPQMETTFVDPTESNASELEHKIIVEDVSPKKKENMQSKVDKLKGLMGKLPNKPA